MHIILLILSEIWSKGSNFTGLLLFEVFAEVAEVNTEEKPRQNVFSYSYLGILFVAAKNAEIRGLSKFYLTIANFLKKSI